MSEKKKIQEYANEQITVRFDPNICMHSAVCIHDLPSVFDIKRKRWVEVNGDTVENIIALVKKCPSGALSYQVSDALPVVEEAPTVVVTVATNSALRIAGKIRIVDLEGNLILETEKCSLCRCGASEKKPFCDGSHKKIGWVGEAQSLPS